MRLTQPEQSRGYSLIELLTAAGILAVLLLITFALYRNYMTESRTTDALNAMKAVELEIRAPARMTGGLHHCDNSLVSAQNLKSDYLTLGISHAPNDMSNPNSALGYAAVLMVSADVATNGGDGVAVAKLFHEEMKTQRSGDVIGDVVTDSAVAFALRLSPPGEPYCDLALATTTGSPATATSAVNRPPIAGKDIKLGSTAEDTPVAINTAQLINASFDVDLDSLTVTAISAANGTVTGDSTSGYTYTPAKDFHGDNVTLTYEISDGQDSSRGTALIDVTSVIDEPVAKLTLSAAQQIMNTGTNGRAIVNNLQTGGNMNGITLEFSVVGRQGGDAAATSGPVIFNYGTQSDNNAISAWRPSNFTIAPGGHDYATGINIADGNNHRVTTSWSSATGVLKVFDNGVLVKTFNDVHKNQEVAGNGHLVIAQKMNNPGSGGGWNANEHYSGQVFGATLSTHVYSDQEIAGAPLYARKQNIVADLRNEGGSLQDLTGQHRVEMQGDHSTSTVDVDTALALIPPGSEVRLQVSAQAGDTDSQVESIQLSGLGSLTLSDGSRSGSGTVDITNWNLGSLKIALPAGFSNNQTLTLSVSAGDGSDSAQTDVTQVLRMRP